MQGRKLCLSRAREAEKPRRISDLHGKPGAEKRFWALSETRLSNTDAGLNQSAPTRSVKVAHDVRVSSSRYPTEQRAGHRCELLAFQAEDVEAGLLRVSSAQGVMPVTKVP